MGRTDEGAERAMQMLERWVATYQPTVFKAAYLILRDPDGAEDVAQDTFIRAYRAADRLEPGAEIRSWLYKIATNLALNVLRSEKRKRQAVERLDVSEATPDVTDRRDTSRVVADAIDRLPDRLRVPVILRYYLDLSEKEIAATLDIRPGTVKSRLHDARKQLADDDAIVAAASGGA